MTLKILPYDLTVCKVGSTASLNLADPFYFIGKTDEEISLVCPTENTPGKGFRIEGVLDFSMIGVLSKISGILADCEIGIFVVSTFNTDYVLVKRENFARALTALEQNGYSLEMAK